MTRQVMFLAALVTVLLALNFVKLSAQLNLLVFVVLCGIVVLWLARSKRGFRL